LDGPILIGFGTGSFLFDGIGLWWAGEDTCGYVTTGGSRLCLCYLFPCMSHSAPVFLTPTPDERSFALLAHLLQIIAGWLGALIIFLVKRDSRFVSFHALQVLFLQIAHLALMMLVGLSCFFLFFVVAIAPRSHVPSPLPLLIFPIFLLGWAGPWIAIVVMGIVYGTKANQGEWVEYPVVGELARKVLHIGPGGTDLRPTVLK
jgi:uncharacterized membrane protein